MADRKVARGIWWTSSGWRLYVRVAGRLRPKRVYDPEHHLGLVELKDRRHDWRTDARRDTGQSVGRLSPSNTFAYDAHVKYLPAVAAMPGIAERRYHIGLWVREFGDRPRASIQPWEIAQVRDRWLTVGPKRVCVPWDDAHPKPKGCNTGRWIDVATPLSPRQVNNRMRALENLWTRLDGRHAPNPAREAGEATEEKPKIRAVAPAVVEAILAAMPDRGRPVKGKDRDDVSLTKLRLRAMYETGFSHGELGGLDEDDLHLEDEHPWVWVDGRRKGHGTEGGAQPLTKRGAAAVRALRDVDGLGPFNAGSMWKSFQRACRKLELTGLTPYAFRHSFATDALRKTKNLSAVQLVMRHKDPRTTRRYAEAAIDPVRLATVQQLDEP